MANLELQRVALPTGVELDVAVAGLPTNPPIILLHGFPESHRTWRHQIADLAEDHFVLAPDQRGFARSSKPEGVANYTPDKPVADMIALADRFDLKRFTLVGHDWGGAIAWMAALNHPDRVARLIIINAPHPFIFQKSMFDDMAQREASQYIRAFRNTDLEKHIDSIGLSAFFDGSFMRHTDFEKVKDEKPIYLEQWGQPGAMTAMLNWYRASKLVVPPPGLTVPLPDWLLKAFPKIAVPTLVIWGMKDAALLPVQLDGLDELVEDLGIARLPDAGHFAPWEAPDDVAAALEPFLAEDVTATAPAA